jgi:hypothetical protein
LAENRVFGLVQIEIPLQTSNWIKIEQKRIGDWAVTLALPLLLPLPFGQPL